MLKAGITGLPNVGKSTLFNALLKKQVADAANYPFCTIEPNIGVIEVPDERLAKLAEVVKTNKIVPAAIEFYDIAGLVRGASQGEGLGNQFLSHIKETALLIHVVRFFPDSDITHVDNTIDPVRDIQTIETELMLADIAVLDKQKEPKGKASRDELARWEAIQMVLTELNKGVPVRSLKLSDEQLESLKEFNLLTLKPQLFVANVSEDQLMAKDETEQQVVAALKEATGLPENLHLMMCVKLEQDIVALEEAEQLEYLQEYGLERSGLERLIKEAYARLGLISFLTAGEIEARAWTITQGTLAPQAAAVIHTDFEKKFIKVEAVPYDFVVELGGWHGSREAGKVTLGGKDYVMKDGDVVDFKIGV